MSALTTLGALTALLALTATNAVAASGPPSRPNLAKTIETQKRVVAERPQDPAVWNDLGNLMVLSGKPADAETAYRRAVELDPNKVAALFNLGLLLQQQGKSGDAMELYQRVVKLEPKHAWAHFQIGTIHERRGQSSRAIRAYSQAFALDPDLAFRDVNAEVVDSRLVTQSLLRAYRQRSAVQAVPQVYDEKGRIGALLEPKPPKPGAKEGAESQAVPPEPAAGQAGKKVLRPGDLPASGSNLGQALPPGSHGRAVPSYGPGYGVPTNPGAAPGQPGGTTQWRRPEPRMPNPNLDATTPGQVVTPPSGPLYYRPGVPSTGRLSSRVVTDNSG
ncbi:MAG TPA: tetratricopeptide repeat protein [Thermoanaerobaculia bacterium]|nr:tetratricopeptide repeat protein [Thermoanaerobaculia bacterium]